MKPQRGYSTLLMTSMILLLVLVVSLASYRTIFQYYRIAQHRLVSLQDQWQAEGAIECVFAKSKIGSLFPLDIDECTQGVDQLDISGHLIKRVYALRGFSALSKEFVLPTAGSSGVIKTSANLVLGYSAKFEPDPGEINQDSDWQCVAIRYKHRLLASSLTTYHPYQMAQLPYNGFPESGEYLQRCAMTHFSDHLSASYANGDYLYDADLDPFSDLFGVDESQWFSLIGLSSVGRVPASLDSNGVFTYSAREQMPEAQFVSNCAEQIATRVNQGKDLVWVYGGCELNDRDISQINQAISLHFPSSGIILVVHNGLLAVQSQQLFRGMVMQFTSSDAGILPLDDWDQTTFSAQVDQFISQLADPHLTDSAQINYYQLGRFNPLGGLLLSSDDSYAVIQGQLDFHFQRDLIAPALSHVRPTHWVMASWSDGVKDEE